ncbi:MAG TPA: 5'/3'-nucleotidase SurE [Spirochaetia bacterium]|nr:5'/3'-nucleotidase SurE [Spirochaetia bacterium]
MKILCTNDDGVVSPGLAAAAEAALGYADVVIAAPSSQKTGAGRSLIGDRTRPFSTTSIAAGTRSLAAYHMEATPALVVRHALSTVFRGIEIDLAISGINYGENMGYDIGTSGTVGAAMECAVLGVPAIAVSVQTEIGGHRTYGQIDWSAAKLFLGRFIRRFIDKGGFADFDVLKIDVPIDADADTEWEVCKLQRSPYYLTRMTRQSDDAVVADATLYTDPSGYAPGTDAHALMNEGKVAVTPLILDWTAPTVSGFFR